MKKMFYKIGLILLGFTGSVYGQINTPSGAVVPFNSNPGYASGIKPTNLPTSGTFGKSQDAADAYIEWKAFYSETCSDGSIRIKFDDPSKTVSEGIAYGMLLAAYAADKAQFDGLYKYWKKNISSLGAGMNWRTLACAVDNSGSGSATDSDFDCAYALLVAANQWPTATSPYTYSTEANTMLNKIASLDMDPSNNQANNGDAWGNSTDCRNPSYQSPAYYREFATKNSANSSIWNNSVTGAYSMLSTNANATTGLVSDWASKAGVRNTCNNSGTGSAPTNGYGYDASRFSWRMAQDACWNGNTTAQGFCNKIAAWANGKGASGVGGPLNQDGSNYSGWAHNATFVSTFALAVMGSTGTTYQTLLNNMYTETKNVKDPMQNVALTGYFGNTLRCMSLFMLTGNFWKLGTSSVQDINVRATQSVKSSPSSTTVSLNQQVPSAGSYDFGNVKTGSTKDLTFTIENLGNAALTLTGATKVTIAGGAGFSVTTQPTASSLNLGATTTFVVRFTSTTLGTQTATVTIANNDPDASEAPYTITLVANCSANDASPKMSVYAMPSNTLIAKGGTFSTGTASASSNNQYTFKIKNTGDNALTFTGTTPFTATGGTISSTGALAAGTTSPNPTTTTVAVGDSAYFVYKFTTSATAGNITGTVSITSDDASTSPYNFTLTGTLAACPGAITANDVIQDWDGNSKSSTLGYTNTAWVESSVNPQINSINTSYYVAKFTRPKTGTYSGVRYGLCGTTNYIALTTSKYIVSVYVYSPKAGMPIQMNLKTDADVANTTTYPATSSVTMQTTKSGQWELMQFDHSAAIGKTAIRHVEIFCDPTLTDATGLVYYIDNIKLSSPSCATDVSGILKNFDTNNNIDIQFTPVPLTENTANPSATGINTSANVAKYVRPVTATYDLLRYKVVCTPVLSSGKTIIAMDIYSPAAGVTVNMDLKDAVSGATVNSLALASIKTSKVNAWERVYFDFSSFTTLVGSSTVKAIDIFFDPLAANAVAGSTDASRTFYFDNIQFATSLPCIASIANTNVLNDFDNLRNVDLKFAPVGTYNDFAANPSATGVNTTTGVSQFVRATDGNATTAGVQPDILRYAACAGKFTLAKGKSTLGLQVYSPNATNEVIISLKKADGTTEVMQSYAKFTGANTWTDLNFDFTDSVGSQNVAFIDVILDPNNTNSGASSLAAARTYYIDNLRYTSLPEIAVNSGTTKFNNLATDTLDFGSVVVGSNVSKDITISNNGGADLVISTIPFLGADSVNYAKTFPTQFSKSVGIAGSTTFTLTFQPTSGGKKVAAVKINTNDGTGSENPFYINIKGVATCPTIAVPTVANTTYTYCVGSTASQLSATASAGNTLYWYTTPTGGTSTSIAPTPSTVNAGNAAYYVSQGANGCESSRVAISVTVYALPTAAISTSGSGLVYCSSSNGVTLSATTVPSATYEWFKATASQGAASSVATLANATAGSYTVKVTSSASCSSTSSAVTVSSVTASTANAGTAQTSVTGPTATLSATGSATGAWSLVSGPITSGINFTPSANNASVTVGGLKSIGLYTFGYTVAGATPCPDVTSNVTLDVTTVTSLEELTLAGIKVYPTVTSGILNIELTGSATFSVVNVIGHVSSSTTISGSGSIDVSSLTSGVYFLNIVKDGKSYVSRFVKQ